MAEIYLGMENNMWHLRKGTVLVEPGDRVFWNSLWQSEVFKNLLNDERQPYGQLLESAMQRPWWFVDAEQEYERRHFSIWFGQVFLRRSYDNPVITDLYYWHDLMHAMTFQNLSNPEGMSESEWRIVMRANEIKVSIETEMLIYLRAPDLRAQSFKERIWLDDLVHPLPQSLADRLSGYRQKLLKDQNFAAQEAALRFSVKQGWPLPHPEGQNDRDASWFWDLRRAVTLDPNVENPVEVALHRYEEQAWPYYAKWSNHWREVESARSRFEMLLSLGYWRQAVKEREDCWLRVADDNGVPYGTLAPRLKRKKA